jgi:hypothetical protein
MISFIVFPFLALGCAAFLICTAIPSLRRFALSTSLWFAACIPCLLGCATGIIVFGLGVHELNRLFQRNQQIGISFNQASWFWWLIAIALTAIMLAGASAITLLHGLITRRMTLALFRIYVASVSFGVGMLTTFFTSMVFGAGSHLSWFIAANLSGAIPAMVLAYFCYRNAKQFRGDYPKQLPIIDVDEFG